MTYTQALDYIRSANRPFCKPGLERVAALCEALGNPQDRLQIIHVTGTNGKGSFCAMLESVLRRGPYKTGLFTSPYIREINECMAVDGQSITDEELAELTAYIRPFAAALEDAPTEFELLTAMAFVYFHRHECAVVVVETGMGGRLDSTNVIRHPLLSVITGISLDHTAFLGDTVEKIASEKAGIVKPGAPVLYGGEEEAAWQVVEAVAQAKGSPVSRMDYASLTCHRMTLNGTQFDYGDYRKMELSLLGTYQPRNAAVVLQAVDLLRSQGLAVPESAVREGLVQVQWPGRFQLLSAQPPVIFDGAHNAQGIAAAVDSIAVYFPKRKVYVLTGVLQDKDYHTIADCLAQVTACAFVMTPDNPRALPGEEYAVILRDKGVPAQAYATVREAYAAALHRAREDNVPLVCLGSLYTYRDIAGCSR